MDIEIENHLSMLKVIIVEPTEKKPINEDKIISVSKISLLIELF